MYVQSGIPVSHTHLRHPSLNRPLLSAPCTFLLCRQRWAGEGAQVLQRQQKKGIEGKSRTNLTQQQQQPPPEGTAKTATPRSAARTGSNTAVLCPASTPPPPSLYGTPQRATLARSVVSLRANVVRLSRPDTERRCLRRLRHATTTTSATATRNITCNVDARCHPTGEWG